MTRGDGSDDRQNDEDRQNEEPPALVERLPCFHGTVPVALSSVAVSTRTWFGEGGRDDGLCATASGSCAVAVDFLDSSLTVLSSACRVLFRS